MTAEQIIQALELEKSIANDSSGATITAILIDNTEITVPLEAVVYSPEAGQLVLNDYSKRDECKVGQRYYSIAHYIPFNEIKRMYGTQLTKKKC